MVSQLFINSLLYFFAGVFVLKVSFDILIKFGELTKIRITRRGL